VNLEGTTEKVSNTRVKSSRVKYYENILDEIIAKECTKCSEIKSINDFGKEKKGLGYRKSSCKVCEAESKRKWHENNREKNVERSRKWREDKPEYHRNYRQDNKEHKAETDRNWRLNNPEKSVIHDQNRRARKRALLNDLTAEQTKTIYDYFGGCALTGGTSDTHWDHAIPLTTNYGGTTYCNMVPLRGDLNMSKQDANIFEWFTVAKQRFNLEQERFDRLIEWLGKANGMTVEEYRDYVYECHTNTNILNDAKATK
jgi:hypothetical protein